MVVEMSNTTHKIDQIFKKMQADKKTRRCELYRVKSPDKKELLLT